MWMNQWEVEEIYDICKNVKPEFVPYAKFLNDWKDTVNANSDGWAYWKAGSKAAEKLMNALHNVKLRAMGRMVELPTEAELKKALTPIKSLATRKGLPAPVLEL